MLDSQDFAELKAYNRISPFGDEGADLRNVILAYEIHKCLTSKSKMKPLDFLVANYFGLNPKEEQTPQQMAKMCEIMAKIGKRK